MPFKMKGWSPFKTSASGIYSPEARAARHSKDAFMIKAKRLAQAEADAKAGGSAGFAPVLPRHLKAAKDSKEFKKALKQSGDWYDKRA
mgnify:CR=1 FL=1